MMKNSSKYKIYNFDESIGNLDLTFRVELWKGPNFKVIEESGLYDTIRYRTVRYRNQKIFPTAKLYKHISINLHWLIDDYSRKTNKTIYVKLVVD